MWNSTYRKAAKFLPKIDFSQVYISDSKKLKEGRLEWKEARWKRLQQMVLCGMQRIEKSFDLNFPHFLVVPFRSATMYPVALKSNDKSGRNYVYLLGFLAKNPEVNVSQSPAIFQHLNRIFRHIFFSKKSNIRTPKNEHLSSGTLKLHLNMMGHDGPENCPCVVNW